MFNNGNAIPDAIVSATSAANTDLITLPLHDVLRVIKGCCCNKVNLSFQLSADASITSAIVTVENIH